MKTNKEKLVQIAVSGQIHSPTLSYPGYYTGHDGTGHIVPGTGGITYNFRIGDSCMDLVGDHVEPCVSSRNMNEKENGAYTTFSCVGNIATIMSGKAAGCQGYVTGKHGGIEHIMIDFEPEITEQLQINDQIQIRAYGQGLRLLDYPSITCMNLDPDLLERMNIIEHENYIQVPVSHILPAHLMGSGLGSSTLLNCDYDIMTKDKHSFQTYHLETLRFGDIVAIENHRTDHGAEYAEGAITIGVIVHSDSFTAGHGPGVTVLLSCNHHEIHPVLDKQANLRNYFYKASK